MTVTTTASRVYAALEALVDPVPNVQMALVNRLHQALTGLPTDADTKTRGFPLSELAHLASSGVTRVLAPASAGGELEWSSTMRVAGRLAAHDLGLTLVLGGAILGGLPVLIAGSTQQQNQYFTPLLRGEVGGLGLSEWECGSDLARIQTQAFACDARGSLGSANTHFALRGQKAPINNGNRGRNVVVLARTDVSEETFSSSLFLIPRDTPGLEQHRALEWQGSGAIDLSGIVLNDALVPAGALLGNLGEGFLHTRKTLEISRSGVAVMALGAGVRAWSLALAHAQGRKLYGAPIAELAAVRLILGRATAHAIAAMALARFATRAVAHAAGSARHWTAASKLLCPELSEKIVQDAGTLLGARSLLPEFGFAFLRQNSPLFAIFDGSSQLQLDELWRSLPQWVQPAGTTSETFLRLREPATSFDACATADLNAVNPLLVLRATLPASLTAFADLAAELPALSKQARAGGQTLRFALSRAVAHCHAMAAVSEASQSQPTDFLTAALHAYAALVAEAILVDVQALSPGMVPALLALCATRDASLLGLCDHALPWFERNAQP